MLPKPLPPKSFVPYSYRNNIGFALPSKIFPNVFIHKLLSAWYDNKNYVKQCLRNTILGNLKLL